MSIRSIVPMAIMLVIAFSGCESTTTALPPADHFVIIPSSSAVAGVAHNGREVWRTHIGEDSESAIVSPLVIGQANVYVSSGGKPSSADWYVAALRKTDGKQVWQSKTELMIDNVTETNGVVTVHRHYGPDDSYRASDGKQLGNTGGS